MQYNIASRGGPPGTSPAASRIRSVGASSAQATGCPRCGPWPPISGSARRRWPTPTASCNAVACWSDRGAGEPMSGGNRRSPPVCPWQSPPAIRDLRTGGPDPDLLPALLPPVRGRRAARLRRARRSRPGWPRWPGHQLAADGIDAGAAGRGGRGPRRGRAGARGLAAPRRPGGRRGSRVHRIARPAGGVGHGGGPGRRWTSWGIRPDRLAAALGRGADAVLLTPRAQNPTGTAWDTGRVAELEAGAVAGIPELLVIEDDHAGPAAGRPRPHGVPGPGALGHHPLGVQVARPRPAARRAGRRPDHGEPCRGSPGARHRLGQLPPPGHRGRPVGIARRWPAVLARAASTYADRRAGARRRRWPGTGCTRPAHRASRRGFRWATSRRWSPASCSGAGPSAPATASGSASPAGIRIAISTLDVDEAPASGRRAGRLRRCSGPSAPTDRQPWSG